MGINILMKDSILLDFLSGSKNALPIVAGYLPLGFACGVISDDAGLTLFQTAKTILKFWTFIFCIRTHRK